MKLFDFCQSQNLQESQPGVMHMPVQGEPRRGQITLGQTVQTIRGTQVQGVVERITPDRVIIRTESGRIFKTPRHNVSITESSDPSGIFHAAKHLNKEFEVVAEIDGKTRKFQLPAQSERVARETVLKKFPTAEISSVEDITDKQHKPKVKKQGVAEGSDGVSVRGWANQVRKDHGPDVKFWNRKEGGGAVDSVIARNSQGETVGVYNRKTGYPTVFEPKQDVAETANVTDYEPKSQGGTRQELLAKYHKTRDPKDAEAARKAGATQRELQGVAEGSEEKTPEYYKKLAQKHEADGQTGTEAGREHARKMAGRAREAAAILTRGGSQAEAWRHYQGTKKKRNRVVIQRSEPVGHRIADIGPGGSEHNVQTDAAWRKKHMAEGEVVEFDLPQTIKKLALDWHEYTALEDGPEQAALAQSLSSKGFDIEYAEDYSNMLELTGKRTGKKFFVRIPTEMQGLGEGCGCSDPDHDHGAEPDHEVNMARADLYKLSRYAAKLHDMLTHISEEQGLQGWQQAKITKAADYISAVYHSLDYDQKFSESRTPRGRILEGRMKDIATHGLMRKLDDAIAKYNRGLVDADTLGRLTAQYAKSISTDMRIPPHAVLRMLRDRVVRNIRDLATESLTEDKSARVKNFMLALAMAANIYGISLLSVKNTPVYAHIEYIAQHSSDPAERSQAKRDLDALLVSDDTGKSISDILERYGFRSPEERYSNLPDQRR